MENNSVKEKESQRITVSILIPLLFVCALWLIYFIEYARGKDFSILGILPRSLIGLTGILFTPFLHGSFSHLMSNTIPLLVLGSGFIYFYRNIAYKIFLLIWLIDGLGVWLLGREAYHIGASGLVYGMASFLIFSGILRKNRRLLALAMVIIFVYGGLIWGMLPYIPDVSWEAHLFGFLAGIYFSIHYLLDGPPNDPVPEWMHEDEEQGDSNGENNINDQKDNEGNSTLQENINVKYIYLPTGNPEK
ncbi:MAG: rhomboid family intramembrane serine protease [Chitinophagales bacterium]|jgi:membrane associated rhomboid family serine protease|nr:rhomboid family intramembrane serine protease [Chitinophagales bacterium]